MTLKRVLLVLTLAAVAAAPAAWAHLVYTTGLYVKDPLCVGGTSGLAEGPPQAMVDAYTQNVDVLHSICLTAKNRPAGTFRVKRQLFRWTGSAWKLCAGSGWIYNTSSTSYMHNFRQWPGGMPCGAGTYKSIGFGQTYYNGIWYGGSRSSGSHYFP
jgi:hypothetical protein